MRKRWWSDYEFCALCGKELRVYTNGAGLWMHHCRDGWGHGALLVQITPEVIVKYMGREPELFSTDAENSLGRAPIGLRA